MQIKGLVKEVSKVININDSFKKRELVIETQEKYPQKIKFDFLNKSIDLLSVLSTDDEVDVHFNIRGTQYNGKYYVNLTGWKIEKTGSSSLDSEQNAANKTSKQSSSVKKVEKKTESSTWNAQQAEGRGKPADDEEDLTF